MIYVQDVNVQVVGLAPYVILVNWIVEMVEWLLVLCAMSAGVLMGGMAIDVR